MPLPIVFFLGLLPLAMLILLAGLVGVLSLEGLRYVADERRKALRDKIEKTAREIEVMRKSAMK